jgi:hypothetical protein
MLVHPEQASALVIGYSVDGVSGGGLGNIKAWQGTFLVDDGSKSIIDASNISEIRAERGASALSFRPTFSSYFPNYIKWEDLSGQMFRILLADVPSSGSWNSILGSSFALASE